MIRYYFSMLSLVPSPVSTDAGIDPFGPKVRRRRAAGRPGDVREPWNLKASASVRLLAAQALELPVHLDTAIALVIERELLRRDLDASERRGGALASLDVHAVKHVAVRLALRSADAVYLRSLTHGAEIDEKRLVVPRPGTELCVGLPARLSAQIFAAGGPQALVEDGDLELAVRLEIAAVCAGRTMSEWAAWTLLSG
jgi:hypothetical protein